MVQRLIPAGCDGVVVRGLGQRGALLELSAGDEVTGSAGAAWNANNVVLQLPCPRFLHTTGNL